MGQGGQDRPGGLHDPGRVRRRRSDRRVHAVLVQEELCYGDIGIGNCVTSSGFFADPVLELGTEEQKERWLRPLTGPTIRR